MRYSKQSIYDRQLDTIAHEVIVDDASLDDVSDEKQLWQDFLNILIEEITASKNKARLFIPSDLHPYLDDLPEEFASTVTIIHQPDDEEITLSQPSLTRQYPRAVELFKLDSLLAFDATPVDFIIVDSAQVLQSNELIIPDSAQHKVIVKNINDYSTLEKIKALGISLYQGEFIEKPTTLEQSAIAANKITMLKLMTQLNDPDIALDDVSQVILADSVLSYKLLRIVNSPLFRGMMAINSIQDAIIRFGYTNLKKWALMLNLCSIDNKPIILTKLAIQRALMCFQLAQKMNLDNCDKFYTAGLFSTLDAFLDHPMPQLLEVIELSEELKQGILSYQGETGQVLKRVIDYQRGQLNHCDELLVRIYINSCQQAQQTLQIIGLS